MTKLLLSLTLLFTWTTASAPAHDFHMSKTTIRYAAEREQIQIEMHVFLDDLELALTEAGAPKLYIGTDLELKQAKATVARYLDKHFKLIWNGTELPVGLLGYELSDDLQALWIYLQAKSREMPTSLSVQNTVLTELYDDQRNLIKVISSDGDSRGTTLLLSRDQPSAKHQF